MREGLRRELLTQKVIDREVGSKVSVTDQEIGDFYAANRPQFNVAEEAYRLAQIVVTPVRDAQLANRTGDDAATPEAAAAKVQMLMERLKAGASFGDLAVGYSEDPGLGSTRRRSGTGAHFAAQAGATTVARRRSEQGAGLGERGERWWRVHDRRR